ncbi:MAG: glycosyltransferase family 4 protein [Desulfobaccales bacterium]
MRVLIITHIFWPEGADFKNMALATRLAERGHDVTVLAPFPNYPLGRLYDGYKLSWRQWEKVNGVRVLRVPLYPDHSSSGFKRILNYGSFTASVVTIGLMLTDRMDVIFVHSPPMTLGWAAGLFKFLYKSPILLDVVDLWPEAISGSGMVSSSLVIKITEWIALGAYALADRISVLTNGYASRLQSAGVSKLKMLVTPPSADGDLFQVTERNRKFGEIYELEGKFCIIHAGNIGPFQGIHKILAAAEKLRHIDRFRVVFVGGGRDLEAMKKEKEDRHLDNVIFAGSYPVEEMSGILAWGNALLVSLRSDPYMSINFPSKMAAYMAVGRPIIACAEGEASRLVTENRLGFSCRPGDPAALAEAFVRFMDLSEDESRRMGNRSRALFEQSYEKNVLIEKYVALLEEMSRR